MRFELSAQQVAKAIGIPTERWKGNCFGIATAMVKAKLVKGRAVYGHWTGPISRFSYFADRRGQGFTNHGWVLLEDGETVVDPTRWVFEASAPYIFVGVKELECPDFQSADPLDPVCVHCGHVEDEHERGFFSPCKLCKWPYDEGGNELREMMRRDPPEADPADTLQFPVAKFLSKEAKKLMVVLFGEVKLKPKLTWKQAHYIATLPYEEYRDMAHEFYTALEKAKAIGLVPIDNQMRAKREALPSKMKSA